MYLICTQVIGKQVFTIRSDTDTMQMRFLLSFLVYSDRENGNAAATVVGGYHIISTGDDIAGIFTSRLL